MSQRFDSKKGKEEDRRSQKAGGRMAWVKGNAQRRPRKLARINEWNRQQSALDVRISARVNTLEDVDGCEVLELEWTVGSWNMQKQREKGLTSGNGAADRLAAALKPR